MSSNGLRYWFFIHATTPRKSEKSGFDYLLLLEQSKSLHELIKNPFNLSLFSQSAPLLKKYKDYGTFKFKEKITSRGELMWNYFFVQLASYLDRMGYNQKDENYLLREFLFGAFFPILSLYLQQKTRSLINHRALREQVSILANEFWVGREKIFEDDPQYLFFVEKYCIPPDGNGRSQVEALVSIIKKIFIEELAILVEIKTIDQTVYTYAHDFFRAYFSAKTLYFDLEYINKGKGNIEQSFLNKSFFSYGVLQLLGQLLEDHYNSPYLQEANSNQQYQPTVLDNLVKRLKGHFNKPGGSFFVYNVIEIWNATRGTLAGADLSNLDLRRAFLGGKEFSGFFRGELKLANFKGALLNTSQFFKLSHRTGFSSNLYNISPLMVNATSNLLFSSTTTNGISVLWSISNDSCYPLFSWWFSGVYFAEFYAEDILLVIGTTSNGNEKTIEFYSVEIYTDGRPFNVNKISFTYLGLEPHRFKIGKKNLIIFNYDTNMLMRFDLPSLKKVFEKRIEGLDQWSYFIGLSQDETSFFTSGLSSAIIEWDTATLQSIKSVKLIEEIPDSPILSCFITKNEKDLFFIEFFNSPDIYKNYHSLLELAEKNGIITAQKVEIIDQRKSMGLFVAYDWRQNKILERFACDDKVRVLFADEYPIFLISYMDKNYRIDKIKGFYSNKQVLAYSIDSTIATNGNTPAIQLLPVEKPELALVAMSEDQIAVVGLRTGTVECVLNIDIDEVASYNLSPDQQKLLVIQTSNCIEEYDLATGQFIQEYFTLSFFKGRTYAAYSPDGDFIFAGYPDGEITRYLSGSEDEVLIVSRGMESRIADVAYSPKLDKMAIALSNGYIQQFDYLNGRCYVSRDLQHYTRLTNIYYDPLDLFVQATDTLGNVINVSNLPGINYISRPEKLGTGRICSLETNRDDTYQLWADYYGNLTVKKLGSKSKNKLKTLETGAVLVRAHFLKEKPGYIVTYRKNTYQAVSDLIQEPIPSDFSEVVTDYLIIDIYACKKLKKPVWTGVFSYIHDLDRYTINSDVIGDIVFSPLRDEYLLISHFQIQEKKSYIPNPYQPQGHTVLPTRVTNFYQGNLLERITTGDKLLVHQPAFLSLRNMPTDAQIYFSYSGTSILIIFSLYCPKEDLSMDTQLIIGEIELQTPEKIKLSRINQQFSVNNIEIKLINNQPKRIGIFAKHDFLITNLYQEYSFDNQLEDATLIVLSSYPAATYSYHNIIPEAGLERSLFVYPDFSIFGCELDQLHPNSQKDDYMKRPLQTYGAIFDDSDREICAAILNRLNGKKNH